MRTSLLCAAVAAALVGGTFVQPAAAQGTSVVVIDISYIFKNHIRFKEAQEAMKKQVEQFEETIRAERDAITKLAETLKTFQPDSPDYKAREEQIAERTGKLQLETARARKDFLQQEAKLYHDTYQQVSAHVANFARENNINLVLRFSSEPIEADDRNSVLQGINRAVVYQNQLNITSHILKMVNGAGHPVAPTAQPAAVAPQGGQRQAFGPVGQPR